MYVCISIIIFYEEVTITVLVSTVNDDDTMFVAEPLSLTCILVAPGTVPPSAIMVNDADVIASEAIMTVAGLNKIPVAVGVKVISPPTAALLMTNVTLSEARF